MSYAVVLLFTLTNMPMQWDETPHLNGALYLNTGSFGKFLGYSFYPPLFDAATACAFQIFGANLFAARLVPLVFSVLSLWMVFELAYTMYGGKVALLSAVLMGIMPGYFWLSQEAMLETMLVFFTAASFLFFFKWLKNRQDKLLIFSGLALGLGFLTKYQMVAAAVVMVVSLLFLARGQLKLAFKKFSLTIVTATLVVVPWVAVAAMYMSGIFSQWLYALAVGNPERVLYSSRYPLPIFYLVEMVWPYSSIHPISVFLYAAGLAGLGLLAWRHKAEDKFLLIWFLSILAVFTFIENKEWRYVLPLFPALAISASALVFFLYDKAASNWKAQVKINRKRVAKVAAGLLVVAVAGAAAFSVSDSYYIASFYNIDVQVGPATAYAAGSMLGNESIMVLCPFNFFSADMVKFYLLADGNTQIQTYQYPQLPVDTYTPNFNITELIQECRSHNVKYLFTYENGGTATYFNTTLNLQQIYEQIYASGNFSEITEQATFGANPRRIMLLTFQG